MVLCPFSSSDDKRWRIPFTKEEESGSIRVDEVAWPLLKTEESDAAESSVTMSI